MSEIKAAILAGLQNRPSRSLNNIILELEISKPEVLAALRELEAEKKVELIDGGRWRIFREGDPQ